MLMLYGGAQNEKNYFQAYTDLDEYKAITKEIFHALPMRETVLSDW